MKVRFINLYPTEESWIKEAIEQYCKRIEHYVSLDYLEINPGKTKGLTKDQTLLRESEKIMNLINARDQVILLDENGAGYDSTGFAAFLNKRFVSTAGDVVFITGSAYGFHPDLRSKAQFVLSLSKMTFTHQMVRIIFLEQLYRALTILRNEPYHH